MSMTLRPATIATLRESLGGRFDDDAPPVCAFLGSGGSVPGVWAIDEETAGLRQVLELPEGHSVYALDFDSASATLAAGCRGGRIQLLTGTGQPWVRVTSRRPALILGAPILSVCHTGDSQLASSDSAGRCLLWNIAEDPIHPRRLSVPGEPVAALLHLHLDGQGLIGLSATGQLIVWPLPETAPVRTFQGPPPPETLALVRLVHWPVHDLLVYPGRQGQLVLYDQDEARFTSRAAHAGEFFAIAVSGEQLLTIGRSDRKLKFWQADCDEPIDIVEAPVGIFSGAVLGDEPLRLLLVTDGGAASVYQREGHALREERQLDGQDYRVAIGPPPYARLAHQEHRRQMRAQELRAQIIERIEQGEIGDTGALHRELVDLGFEAGSLGLRAREAEAQDDLIAGLDARHRLVMTLPAGESQGAHSMQQYVDMLEKAWLFAEARESCQRLVGMGEAPQRLVELNRYVEVLADGHGIIEPDVPLCTVVRAASVVSSRFCHRWLLQQLEPIPFGHSRLCTDTLAARYADVRAENSRHMLPPAEIMTLNWVSRKEIRQAETIVIGHAPDDRHDGQQIALRVVHDGIQSVVLPSLLFDANGHDSSLSVAEHNDRSLRALERIERGELAHSWYRRVLHFVLLALRRVLTQVVAESDQQ